MNRDGTHDSICRACLITIATVGTEAELKLHESAHVCDPINLYRVSQGYAGLARRESRLRAGV